jgi:integrase
MRHTYRSWLDAAGSLGGPNEHAPHLVVAPAPLAVQQKLMRHADIRTTMDVYGDVVTDEMTVASGKVTRFALNGRESELTPFVLAEASGSRTHHRYHR